MADLRDAVSGGHYAQKQILSRDKLVAWSHARRFATALTLARQFSGKRILDYGSGDGTFLALAMMADAPPAAAVGAELLDDVIDDCRTTIQRRAAHELRSGHSARRCRAHRALRRRLLHGSARARVRLGAGAGADVAAARARTARSSSACRSRPVFPCSSNRPFARLPAGARSATIPERRPYSWSELASAVFAGRTQHVKRPVFDFGGGPAHDHKGFNWRVLRERLKQQFDVTACRSEPLLVAWPRSRHAGVVHRPPSRRCRRTSSLASAGKPHEARPCRRRL